MGQWDRDLYVSTIESRNQRAGAQDVRGIFRNLESSLDSVTVPG
jgi:hypothetical protein